MSEYERPADQPSIADLIHSLVDDTRRLLRDEIALARSELDEKARMAAAQSLRVVVGAVMGMIAGFALCAAIALAIAHALTPLTGREAALWLGPLLMSVVIGIAGAVLIQRGIARFRRETLALDRTAKSIKDAGRMIKERFTS